MVAFLQDREATLSSTVHLSASHRQTRQHVDYCQPDDEGRSLLWTSVLQAYSGKFAPLPGRCLQPLQSVPCPSCFRKTSEECLQVSVCDMHTGRGLRHVSQRKRSEVSPVFCIEPRMWSRRTPFPTLTFEATRARIPSGACARKDGDDAVDDSDYRLGLSSLGLLSGLTLCCCRGAGFDRSGLIRFQGIPAFLIMLMIFLAWHSGILISVLVSESPAMCSLTWGMPGPVFELECRMISHLFLFCWRSMTLSTSFSSLLWAQAALIYITDCRMKEMCAAGPGHCPAQPYL